MLIDRTSKGLTQNLDEAQDIARYLNACHEIRELKAECHKWKNSAGTWENLAKINLTKLIKINEIINPDNGLKVAK